MESVKKKHYFKFFEEVTVHGVLLRALDYLLKVLSIVLKLMLFCFATTPQISLMKFS